MSSSDPQLSGVMLVFRGVYIYIDLNVESIMQNTHLTHSNTTDLGMILESDYNGRGYFIVLVTQFVCYLYHVSRQCIATKPPSSHPKR